jgi:hypothetical protein
MAADIVILGISAEEVQRRLSGWSGGMGCYADFTHLDTRPYRARWCESGSVAPSSPKTKTKN